MNERIRELAKEAGFVQAKDFKTGDEFENIVFGNTIEKFYDLIFQEHINLLRQEWYDLNNAKTSDSETLRDIGYRVGRKAEVIALMDKIKKHFGTE
jgi:hypothetical protein